MKIEHAVQIKPFNTFSLPAVAQTLIRVHSEADLKAIVNHPEYGRASKLVLGGGSNIVLVEAVPELCIKVEIVGRRLLRETEFEWIIEAGGGEAWSDLVDWSLQQGYPGLENLALIPGTVGAAPIQNIGAYGLEIKDRFLSLSAVDLTSGARLRFSGGDCRFAYRDSIFKHELAGKCVITRVQLRLPKPWRPVLSYPQLAGLDKPGAGKLQAREIYEAVCSLRRAKLPDPAELGNVGSFFKNPLVEQARFEALRAAEPQMPGYRQPDGTIKLSAGWLIESCGWKGKRLGEVGVFARHALVLVNYGSASAREVMQLAGAIQESVQRRFGIRLEMEPVLIG